MCAKLSGEKKSVTFLAKKSYIIGRHFLDGKFERKNRTEKIPAWHHQHRAGANSD
jgi:hypothetical protein